MLSLGFARRPHLAVKLGEHLFRCDPQGLTVPDEFNGIQAAVTDLDSRHVVLLALQLLGQSALGKAYTPTKLL